MRRKWSIERACPRCGTVKGRKSFRGLCRICLEELAWSQERKDFGLTARIDDDPGVCLKRFWDYGNSCGKPATWRNGEWRACDEHRIKGDEPIRPAPAGSRRASQDEA